MKSAGATTLEASARKPPEEWIKCADRTLREAIKDGIPQYRLLRGNEDYKSRFATSDPEVETVAVSGGGRFTWRSPWPGLRWRFPSPPTDW